jgi:hypothetical protein
MKLGVTKLPTVRILTYLLQMLGMNDWCDTTAILGSSLSAR